MISVKVLLPHQWKEMAENAHVAVFDETWDKNLERITFALLMVDKEDQIISYATAQEIDKETVYLQYGGAFPKFRGSPVVYKSFCEMVDFLKKSYKTIRTYVENVNYPMLKFYMKNNFLVTGVRYFKEFTLLENCYER